MALITSRDNQALDLLHESSLQTPAVDAPKPIMLLYWGRRGLSKFALETLNAAHAEPGLTVTASVSRQNELFAEFEKTGAPILGVQTFVSNIGALINIWRLPFIRRALVKHLAEHRPEIVIDLMPHVWSVLVSKTIRQSDAKLYTIIHDAEVHPGDYRSASVSWLLDRALKQSDRLLTLSVAVADRLKAKLRNSNRQNTPKIVPLFHPNLHSSASISAKPAYRIGEAIRLVFFGRIMPYKGLDLFLDMTEELSRLNIAFHAAILGEGDLSPYALRLANSNIEVNNQWISDDELPSHLAKFHAVVVSHTEASQSGVVALAHGLGLPVVATPVGGIIEQVEDGKTGCLAKSVDGKSLADAVVQLFEDEAAFQEIHKNIFALNEQRSMRNFILACSRA